MAVPDWAGVTDQQDVTEQVQEGSLKRRQRSSAHSTKEQKMGSRDVSVKDLFSRKSTHSKGSVGIPRVKCICVVLGDEAVSATSPGPPSGGLC